MTNDARAALAAFAAAALVAKARRLHSRKPRHRRTLRVGAVPADSLSPILYAMRTGMFEKAGLQSTCRRLAAATPSRRPSSAARSTSV